MGGSSRPTFVEEYELFLQLNYIRGSLLMKNDTIVITQSRMAGWLMFNRFHKVDEKADLKDRNRKIYIFKDSADLRQAMERYNEFKVLLD